VQSIAPFYSKGKTITGTLYLNVAENFLILQITCDSAQRNEVCQPHSYADVRDFLELKFFMSHFEQYMAISESFFPFLNEIKIRE
jgi:hypothetical protein